MTTHPTPEAPSDGLIDECRDYADMLNAIPTRPMPGERLSAVDARHLDAAALTLTQAAARIQVLEGERDEAVSAWERLTEDPVSSAERNVGRWVYNRASKLMDAKAGSSDAVELAWLAEVIENIEEYGAIHCDGHELAPFPTARLTEAMTSIATAVKLTEGEWKNAPPIRFKALLKRVSETASSALAPGGQP